METIIVKVYVEYFVFFIIHLNCSPPVPTSSCTVPPREVERPAVLHQNPSSLSFMQDSFLDTIQSQCPGSSRVSRPFASFYLKKKLLPLF